MNFEHIKNIIEQTEAGALEQKAERRGMLKSLGVKMAAVTVPLLASSLFNKAKAQTTGNIVAALNDALQIEYLNAEFYKRALAAEGLMTDNLKTHFGKIGADDAAHVGLIKYLLDGLSGPISAMPSTYDFSGGKGKGGPFPNVFGDYDEFLQIAQILKDASVRAYKTLLLTFIPENSVMHNMVNIHSVEARHSAFIRIMRKESPTSSIKPWITGNNSNIGDPFAVQVYAGEDNILQNGIDITNINGYKIRLSTATESFDEPLTREKAMAIFDKFIV